MNILNFIYSLLLAYWSDILVVIIFVGVLVILYRRGKKALVKTIIRTLVVKAEQALGSATGQAKYDLVIAGLYEKLPLLIRLLFSKETLNEYIKDAVKWLNEKLKDPTVNLLTYAQEVTLVSAADSVAIIDKTK